MTRADAVILRSLYYWRHQRGLSQEGLAERIGMNRNTVVRLEASGPTFMRTARLLAKALRVSLVDLMGQPPIN